MNQPGETPLRLEPFRLTDVELLLPIEEEAYPDPWTAGMFPTDQYLPVDAWMSKPIPPRELLAWVARAIPSLGDPQATQSEWDECLTCRPRRGSRPRGWEELL